MKKLLVLLKSATAKDSAALLVGSVISTVGGFVGILVLTRHLPISEFGLFITALTFSQLVTDLFELGVNPSALNFVSLAEWGIRQKFLKVSFVLKLLIAVSTGLSVLILAQPLAQVIFRSRPMVGFIQVSAVGVFIMMLLGWGQTVLQAQKRFIISAVLGSLVNILRLVAVLFFLLIGALNGFSAFVVVQIVTVVLLWYLWVSLGSGFLKTKVASRDYQAMVKFGLPVGLGFSVAAIYTKLDQMLIFSLAGQTAAGVYGLAFRAAAFFLFASSAFTGAITPRFASLHKDDFPLYFKKTLLASLGLVFLALLSIPLAPIFFPLVFGSKFVASVLPFQILVVGISIFLLFSPLNAAIIYRYKKTRFTLWVSILSLGLTWVFLNVLLPRYQSVGAAIAVTSVYGIQFVLSTLYLLYLRSKAD